MRRPCVALLVNPAAAAGKHRTLGPHVTSLLRASGVTVINVSASHPAAASARAQAVLANVEALIVVGGDGSVALGAHILRGTDVPLGIIPTGSGNDFARAAGIPLGNVQEAVLHAVRALRHGPWQIDAIEASTDPHFDSKQSILALGNLNLGFDALVNNRANSSRYGYTGAVIREFLSFTPKTYWLEIDEGQRVYVDASLVTLCNSGMFGNGMRYSPESKLDDGCLELIRVTALSKLTLARVFPRVFSGEHTSVPEFELQACTHVRIGMVHPQELIFFSDGEKRWPLPIAARVLPGAIGILADKNSSLST